MLSTTNPYSQDIDFAALAVQDADFARVYASKDNIPDSLVAS